MSVRVLRGPVFRSRAWTAVISTVSAAAIAVVINVWTATWAWPAGASLGALLLIQALFEWRRAHAATGAPPHPSSVPSRWLVDQHFADVLDSNISAARRPVGGGDMEVRQRLGAVSRSTVVGIGGNSNQ